MLSSCTNRSPLPKPDPRLEPRYEAPLVRAFEARVCQLAPPDRAGLSLLALCIPATMLSSKAPKLLLCPSGRPRPQASTSSLQTRGARAAPRGLCLPAPAAWVAVPGPTSHSAPRPRAPQRAAAAAAAAAAKSLQSCLTPCDPIDSSPPGSTVSGILQARILECCFPNAGR